MFDDCVSLIWLVKTYTSLMDRESNGIFLYYCLFGASISMYLIMAEISETHDISTTKKIIEHESGLYWVATRGDTHFPQYAGGFSEKKTFFFKRVFIKKKNVIEKYFKKLKITFNWKFDFFIIKLYFQLIFYLIRDGLYICCLNLFQALLIFISFWKLALLNFNWKIK